MAINVFTCRKKGLLFISALLVVKLAVLFLPAAPASASEVPLGHGLVAHWPFERIDDDKMTPCVVDETQKAEIVRSDRIEGEFSPELREGMLGRAFRSGGHGGQYGYFAVVEHPPQVEESFTVALWAKPLVGQWLTQLIFYKGGSVFHATGFALRLDGVSLSLSLGGRERLISEIPMAQGVWTFLAFSWDGRAWRIYKNGVLAAESEEHPPFIAPGEGVPMNIGGLNVSMNTVYQGLIDEMRIWNRALTEEDISEVMLADITSREN